MIRILQCVNNMHRAGLETMLMNYYRNIDREKIQFDFLVHRQERSDYDDEIESLGGRIYRAPRLYPQNYPAYFSYMKKFFREHPEYKIMHSHIDAMSYLPLLAGKLAGVPVRIAHSHNTAIDLDMKYPLKQLFRYCLPTAANTHLACGKMAGDFLFRGKEFQVIPNAIDRTAFSFDTESRAKKRKELGVEGRFVLGHAGRFCSQKNHEFLINIFSEIYKLDQSALLLLVGVGETESQIRQKVEKLGLSDSVLFLGKRTDLNELYQAMDVFVMPSLFEGVPVVGVEAQFSGLSCVFSDRVPGEVAFSEVCSFLPLEAGDKAWAEHILSCRSDGYTRCACSNTLYDVKYAQSILSDLYENLYAQIN